IMSNLIRTVVFNNGVKCPMFGLGTWRANGKEAYSCVKEAIAMGYRHIDTAYYYTNEEEVGKGIADAMSEYKIPREEMFVVTKLPNTCNRPSLVLPAMKESLKKLNLDYVDLYLVHSPVCISPIGEVVSLDSKVDENGDPVFDDIDPSVTWKEMEKCVDLGLAKSIGVSNFNSEQVQSVLNTCRIKPITNQVESHIMLQQNKLRNMCQQNNIKLTVFRSLGGQVKLSEHPDMFNNPTVMKIAKKHDRSVSQILLRWHIEKGHILLVKSSNPEHLKSNINIFEFSLTEEDMDELSKLDSGFRFCPFNANKPSKQYPFHIEF
uniref:NADP-dependent oxidoreductase domain-containing protein n=1 Tax=Ciona intestinalis TaxID=7719 RepID=F6WI49_CIOIN